MKWVSGKTWMRKRRVEEEGMRLSRAQRNAPMLESPLPTPTYTLSSPLKDTVPLLPSNGLSRTVSRLVLPYPSSSSSSISLILRCIFFSLTFFGSFCFVPLSTPFKPSYFSLIYSIAFYMCILFCRIYDLIFWYLLRVSFVKVWIFQDIYISWPYYKVLFTHVCVNFRIQ